MSCIVYKYRLWDPTLGANLVDETYYKATRYYENLVRIENHRRAEYRRARATICPLVGQLETKIEELRAQILSTTTVIKAERQKTRTRKTSPELAADLKAKKALLKELSAAHKRARSDASSSELLKSESDRIDKEANLAIKQLRKTLYWGTYLLVEDAAKRAGKDEPGWLTTKKLPDHLQRGRIGIQIQGGILEKDLADDTRIQIEITNPRCTGPHSQPGPSGIFRLRMGSLDDRQPLWAEFPIKIHRPLPSDAVIKWAVVTRTPGHLDRPWIYHLCLTIQTDQHEATLPNTKQEGTTTVNLGWRQENGTLRVATLNNTTRSPEHVLLPLRIYQRFDTCANLQSTIDKQFDVIKKELGAWISSRSDTLPPAFLESFASLHSWRSCRRLNDLVEYWQEHRIPGDETVLPVACAWREKWRHLYQWMTCNRRHALRARLDFYLCLAKQVASTSAKIVLEDFDLSSIARRPSVEDPNDGGQKARENRMRAAPGELRSCIMRAAAKYHCEVSLVPADQNTRQCNVCGYTQPWDQRTQVTHTCPECHAAWDQDVNNTDNQHDLVDEGRDVVLVTPASRDDVVRPSTKSTFKEARKKLPKPSKKKVA